MKRQILGTLRFVLALSLATTLLSAADPLVGTWKLNNAKSTPPSDEVRVITYTEMPNGQLHMNERVTPKQGKSNAVEITFRFDGKPYPRTNSQWDTQTFRRIDGRTYESEFAKAGVQYKESARFVVSPDGKTLEVRLSGKDTKGASVDVHGVFEKQ